MLDINILKNNFEKIKQKLEAKNFNCENLQSILKDYDKVKELMTKQQQLNNERNNLSASISKFMKEKNKQAEVEKIKKQVLLIKNDIDKYSEEIDELNQNIQNYLLTVPNVCDDTVPVGKDETENQEIKVFGSPTKFDFNPLPHWELAKNKKLFLSEEAAKLTGSRFITYHDKGALLYRALQQFTLNENVKAGYTEFLPQEILNEDSLLCSGQLPKFKDDLFKIDGSNYYLSPTAEVQLVNIYRNCIIEKNLLPIKFTANTSCFRAEAGSAGRDTKGVTRLHQFHKSELVIFDLPENSWTSHEEMTRQAESILEKLNLPYRRILLCTGDTGFSSAKTYDLEVWLPSYDAYKEISSCSNCLDFQARRGMIRYKDDNKNVLVHTLNGSSLAIDRLWAAVVENYQQKDGTIKIPEALQPYMNNLKFI